MRLAILGYGDAGNSFCQAATVVEGVEPVAVGGRNPEKAQRIAERYDIAHGTTDELLARDDIDCVAVTTPPGVHAEGAIAFIERGVHAMVEKPMALTVEACRRIIDAADANGVRLMVTQTHRYHRLATEARAILESGELGAPITLVSESCMNYFTAKRAGWQLDPALSGGGVVMNPFIHQIDQARYLSLSEVTEATGAIGAHKPGYAIEGNVECFAKMASGCTALVRVNGYGYFGASRSEVACERGGLELDFTNKRLEVWKDARRVDRVIGVGTLKRTKGDVWAHDGYCAHCEEMRDAIEAGGAIKSDGHNGLINVAIGRALLDSQKYTA